MESKVKETKDLIIINNEIDLNNLLGTDDMLHRCNPYTLTKEEVRSGINEMKEELERLRKAYNWVRKTEKSIDRLLERQRRDIIKIAGIEHINRDSITLNISYINTHLEDYKDVYKRRKWNTMK